MPSLPIKKYPPYMGGDPYIFLSFSREDVALVLPLMKRLKERRIRFYYVHGEGKDAAEAKMIQQRVRDASLMIFIATERSAGGNNPQKGFGQYFESLRKAQLRNGSIPAEQQKHLAVIRCGARCGDMLDYGFSADTYAVTVGDDPTGSRLESAVLHAKGFTRDFIGEPVRVPYKRIFFILAVIIGMAIAALAAYMLIKTEGSAASTDNGIPVTDAAIASAANSAARDLGYKTLNAEAASRVDTLYMDTLPLSAVDFSLFTGLKRIAVPQDMAADMQDLTEGRYEILLLPARAVDEVPDTLTEGGTN